MVFGNLIESHTKHKIVIVGDFNVDFAFNNPGCILFKEFMRDYKLKCSDTLIDSTDFNMFTYGQASLNSHSFIDNFLVDSASYCDVVNCSIDDTSSNLSDHSAVWLNIKTSDPHSIRHTIPSKPAVHTRLRWDKAYVERYHMLYPILIACEQLLNDIIIVLYVTCLIC